MEGVQKKMKKKVFLFLFSLQSIHHLRSTRSHFVVCFVTLIFIQRRCKVMRRGEAPVTASSLLGARSQLQYELEARKKGKEGGRRDRWVGRRGQVGGKGGRIRQKDPRVGGLEARAQVHHRRQWKALQKAIGQTAGSAPGLSRVVTMHQWSFGG